MSNVTITSPIDALLTSSTVQAFLNGLLQTTSVSYASTVTPNIGTTTLLIIGALTGNITIENPTGTPFDGQKLYLRLIQDGTGGRTVSWGTAFHLPAGGSYDLASGAGLMTRFLFEYNAATSNWDVIGNLPGY